MPTNFLFCFLRLALLNLKRLYPRCVFKLDMYDFTEALSRGNLRILWFWFLVFSSGSIPSPFQVHWPYIAFPSSANLEVPQPLSLAAWASAIEVGIISIFSISSLIFLSETLYALYFLFNHFLLSSDSLPFNIFNKYSLSFFMFSFYATTKGNRICRKVSFFSLTFLIIPKSLGNLVKYIGFTFFLFLTWSKSYSKSSNKFNTVCVFRL